MILNKIYSDGAHLKQAIAETFIEEINRSRTVKTVYGVLENDLYLSHCIKHYAPKSPKLTVRIILKISLYMMLFLNKQRYMVTDNAVELCKKLGKGGVSGFVNAFLRKFKIEEVVFPKGDEGLSVKYSTPLFAVKKIKAEYGDRAEAILSAKSQGVTVRFVKNKENYLDREHIQTPFQDALIFKNFVRDDNFFEGDYTFQSVGSIAICDAVEPCEKLIDCCAAPGGKSVLLASKCKEVLSCELHEHRVNLIRQYYRRMNVTNVKEMQADSSVFNAELEEKFDGALCDVPCSGFGTVSENPDIKLNKNEENIRELNEIQLQIVKNCSKYVKRGGHLYYSTCSLFKEENDDIVESFLKEEPSFTVENVESKLDCVKKKYGLQFLPDTAYGAGFYVCKLKKN